MVDFSFIVSLYVSDLPNVTISSTARTVVPTRTVGTYKIWKSSCRYFVATLRRRLVRVRVVRLVPTRTVGHMPMDCVLLVHKDEPMTCPYDGTVRVSPARIRITGTVSRTRIIIRGDSLTGLLATVPLLLL